MKKKYFISILFASIFFSSCSISKKLNRSAKEDILHAEGFVNAHTGISIYEPATGKYWYNYQADKYFTPASNTKLATCYAAMKYLGDSLVGIKYEPINDSTIIIKGMADPSFLHNDFTNNPVFNFLKKYKIVKIDSSDFDDYLGNGWSWGDYMEDYMAQRSAFPIYGNTLKISWNNDGSLNFIPSYFKSKTDVKGNLSSGFKIMKPWDRNDFTIENGNSKFWEIPFNPYQKTLQLFWKTHFIPRFP